MATRARAHFRDTVVASVTIDSQPAQVLLTSATVNVYETGTTTNIGVTMYDASSGGSSLANPLTSGSTNGEIEFWLDEPRTVDLKVTKSGYTTRTVTVEVLESGQEQDREIVNPKTYGAAGDGTTDDTTALNSALALGGTVQIPPGNYLVTGTITAAANTTVHGWGARIFDTTTHRTILSLGAGCKVYGLELQGAGNGSYDAAGVGVLVSGSSAAAYKTDIVLQDCYIHGFGAYGVYGEWTDGLNVRGGRIYDIGYAGVGLLSAKNCRLTQVHIKGITPGTASNAYGAFFSRRSDEASLATYPRSAYCSVSNCTIENVGIWEALDTHGGEQISFTDNRIYNCKRGIIITGATSTAGVETYAPRYCVVRGNTIDSSVSDGTAGYGILVNGAPGASNASSLDPARGCVVSENVVVGFGDSTSALSGGIVARDTIGLMVANNTILEPSPFGVVLLNTNFGFTLTGNSVHDPWTDTAGVGEVAAYRVNSTYQTGTVSGNTDSDGTKVATYTLLHANGSGVSIPSAAATGSRVELGSVYSQATTSVSDGGLVTSKIQRGGIGSYTDADATPSVANGVRFMVVANTGATTITNLDDGVEGQVVTLQFSDANTTVDRSNAALSGSVSFTSSAHDTLTLIKQGTLWREVARGVNG